MYPQWVQRRCCNEVCLPHIWQARVGGRHTKNAPQQIETAMVNNTM